MNFASPDLTHLGRSFRPVKAMSLRIPPPTMPDWENWSIGERMAQANAYLCDTLHVEEHPRGSNTGPEVDAFLAFAGLHAEPWCIAMQIYLANKCGVGESRLPPIYMRASTVQVAKWARDKDKTIDFRVVKRGDIFIRLDADGKHGHAGCVLEVRADGTMRTIEGNTNSDGSREGYAVCRHVRPLGYANEFVRFW